MVWPNSVWTRTCAGLSAEATSRGDCSRLSLASTFAPCFSSSSFPIRRRTEKRGHYCLLACLLGGRPLTATDQASALRSSSGSRNAMPTAMWRAVVPIQSDAFTLDPRESSACTTSLNHHHRSQGWAGGRRSIGEQGIKCTLATAAQRIQAACGRHHRGG